MARGSRRRTARYRTLTAKSLDESRRASGVDTAKNPAQVPMTDPESRIMPNKKEGGFAPNDTPTCLTDGANEFILDAAVIALVNEHSEALPAVDRVIADCGETPENFLADGGMATGPIMAGLEAREITSFVPAEPSTSGLDNPARREDATQIAETPFGSLKGVLGLRQFRHRGLENVEQEGRWSCLSLNFKKLVRAFLRWRREFAAAMALELA